MSPRPLSIVKWKHDDLSKGERKVDGHRFQGKKFLNLGEIPNQVGYSAVLEIGNSVFHVLLTTHIAELDEQL